jgi:hypothetical protein
MLPAPERSDASAFVPTRLESLDALLRGGLPRGELCELAGPASSGRTTLLLQIVSAATSRGELAALIDTCDRLDVESAVAAGVDLDRFLWIRGQVSDRPPAGTSTGEHALDRALKALNLVLQAGGFGVVAMDLTEVPPALLARLPSATWLRVQRALEGRDTVGVLLASQPVARSAGGLTLSLSGRAMWTGISDRARRLERLDITTRAISPRRRTSREVEVKAGWGVVVGG